MSISVLLHYGEVTLVLLLFEVLLLLPPRVTWGIVPIPPGPSRSPYSKSLFHKISTSQFIVWNGYEGTKVIGTQ